MIGLLDFAKSNYKSTIKYGYCKPEIVNAKHSFFKAEDLRHPIVEQINQQELYKANNFEIGTDQMQSAIIQGINGSGKSILLKSISIVIILSQTGLYVPCSKYTFFPFDSILTQISANDNLFQQKSSFIMQMTQIRSIINRSNCNSITICDEILQSTEAGSAYSIFGAMVSYLYQKNIKFVFSTHLDKIQHLTVLQDLDKLKLKHLNVIFNDDGSFIYERSLKDGPGPKNYGLQVAESLNLNQDFISIAKNIQQEILQDPTQNLLTSFNQLSINDNQHNIKKKSRYNAKLQIEYCQICGYYPKNKTDQPLTTHHILPQKDSNDDKFIGYIHQNMKPNLTVLCLCCHQSINKSLFIYGYKQTSQGYILDYEKKI